MKPFSLEEYKQHPDWKVQTRDGRPVKIVYTDRISERPIIAVINETDALYYFANGRANGSSGWDSEDDLFFVIPDDNRTLAKKFNIKMSEFAEELELAITDIHSEEYKKCDGNLQIIIDKYGKELLELTKQELKLEIQGKYNDEVQNSINNAWEEGREYGRNEALNDEGLVYTFDDTCCEWSKNGVSQGLCFMDTDFDCEEKNVINHLHLTNGDEVTIKVIKK